MADQVPGGPPDYPEEGNWEPHNDRSEAVELAFRRVSAALPIDADNEIQHLVRRIVLELLELNKERNHQREP